MKISKFIWAVSSTGDTIYAKFKQYVLTVQSIFIKVYTKFILQCIQDELPSKTSYSKALVVGE